MSRPGTALFALILVVFAVSPATAHSGLILGTEELPELVDADNDVDYDPLYPAAQNHHYLDLKAALVSHDPHEGIVFLTLKVTDATLLAGDTSGWTIQCSFHALMGAEGERTGRISYYWNKDDSSPGLRSGVDWNPEDGGNVNVENTRPDVKHTFTAALEEPGYFVFGVTQQQLLLFGDELSEPKANCYEVFDPSSEVGFLFSNGDGGTSQGSYSVTELHQTKRHDGTFDPIEKLPTESMEPTTSETENGSTPGFTLVLAAVAIAAFSLLRRSH